ncbi:DNA polymerase Y family protein [Altererythrobacter sp. KTW20L]|uniref:DNA polymerase Y family protein n=1 Tax=Altererythrobacter sp. KTW20L TaxID=2942210 RepID=UPI0020C0678D|nr:DNA polymerase Y family protein [Altererythrobacter sp. KTW20L]MCL6251188.1 DNA polymerase Y family protein [Altererythrobacter sp. KTW20L]
MAIWCMSLALDRWRQAENRDRRSFSPSSSEEGAGGWCPPATSPASRHHPQPPLLKKRGLEEGPLALITETAHGPRIDAANTAGQDAGAAPGMMLADARTLCPQLQVVPSDPAGDLAFLERLALWAQRWGPWSAMDAPDGLLVDVSAVAHLFGGEERLLADVQDRLAAQGLAARVAIAPTAGAAWALAHYGPPAAILPPGADVAAALFGLPVASLRLDADVLLVLRRLGLKRVGDMAELGRDAVQRRFRNRRSPAANPLIRLDQLAGRVPEPLLPVLAVAMPLVQRRLMEPIRHRPLLDQVLADLAADLVRELEARGSGARRLELGLWRVDGEVVLRRLELAAATRDAAHICRLFAARLDDVEAGFGIEMARLSASWAEPLALAQADLEAAAEQHGTSLAACIDRISVRLGAAAVRRPVPRGSHVPERAQGWASALEPEPASQHMLDFHARPLKLLDSPEKIAVLYASPDGHPRRFSWRGGVHEVARVEGPERIAPEWWREKGHVRLRDYYRIEDGEGRRYWIFRAGLAGDGRGTDRNGGIPDWFLQGLFA